MTTYHSPERVCEEIGANAIDFELHNSERTEVVLKVLLYQGVVIRDPQIVQVAAQRVQQEEVNEKS